MFKLIFPLNYILLEKWEVMCTRALLPYFLMNWVYKTILELLLEAVKTDSV
jgi:hypothetical protein